MEGTPAKVKQGDEEKRTEGGDETRKKAKMPKRKREKKPKIAVQSIGPGRSEEVEVRESSKAADTKGTPTASNPPSDSNQSHTSTLRTGIVKPRARTWELPLLVRSGFFVLSLGLRRSDLAVLSPLI